MVKLLEESGRFLKKAAQKLLRLLARGVETGTAQIGKVFCFFLFTKRSLLLRLPLRFYGSVENAEAGTCAGLNACGFRTSPSERGLWRPPTPD